MSIDTVAEYGRRKKLAAKWSYPCLLLAALSAAGLASLLATDFVPALFKARVALVLMLVMVASWMLHLYFSSKYQRCPNCGAVPRGRSGGVIHDPWACSACGARLRGGESLF